MCFKKWVKGHFRTVSHPTELRRLESSMSMHVNLERHMRNFARRSAGIYKARDAHLVPWNWRPPMVSIRAEGEEWETIDLTKEEPTKEHIIIDLTADEPEIPTEIPEIREIEREIEPWPETEPEPQGVRRMLFGDPEPQCTEAGTQTEPQPTEQIQELEGSDDEDEEDEEDELEFRRSWTAPARYNNYSGGNAIGLGPP